MYPSVYEFLFPESFKSLSLQESLDCHRCEMACGSQPQYKMDLKCCTYRPFLANYLVGGILLQGSQRARNILISQIKSHQFVTPIGVIAPEAYQLKFSFKQAQDYGNNEELLCPYFNSQGQCEIWNFRSSECLQFHCRSDYGDQGLAFWKSYGELLYNIEILAAQWAMLHKGYDWEEVLESSDLIKIRDFTEVSEQKWSLTNEEMEQLWQHKLSHIEEYYKECYQWVLQDKTLKAEVEKLILTQSRTVEIYNEIQGERL